MCSYIDTEWILTEYGRGNTELRLTEHDSVSALYFIK